MGVIKRQGIKNTIIIYTGVIIGAISVIFVQPYFLTSTEVGFTRNLYNFSFLLSLAVPLGLPNIIMRFYPAHKHESIGKHFLGFVLLYLFVAALLTFLIFLLFKNSIIGLYHADSELFVTYFYCVIPFSLALAFLSCITNFSQAAYKSTVPSFLFDVCARLCVILVTVLYHYRLISFDAYVICYVVIYALVSLIIVFYLQHFNLISLRIRWQDLKSLELRKMIPYGLMSCVVGFTAYGLKSIDAIFLGMTSLSNVAIYSTAVFLALFIEVPLSSVERISHARIAENFATGNLKEIDKIYSESVKYLLVFGGLIFLGMNACARFIFEFLPAEYSAAVNLVLILSFGSLVNISTGVNNAILFYSNYFKTGAAVLVVSFLAAVILDAWLIPKYGNTAAALIT
ncbi:MAG: hypothetical protein JNL60_19620, partial [Bacteroidia bacterium]|nr:hypothetical protein [Bacteroidia bacterium]